MLVHMHNRVCAHCVVHACVCLRVCLRTGCCSGAPHWMWKGTRCPPRSMALGQPCTQEAGTVPTPLLQGQGLGSGRAPSIPQPQKTVALHPYTRRLAPFTCLSPQSEVAQGALLSSRTYC